MVSKEAEDGPRESSDQRGGEEEGTVREEACEGLPVQTGHQLGEC